MPVFTLAIEPVAPVGELPHSASERLLPWRANASLHKASKSAIEAEGDEWFTKTVELTPPPLEDLFMPTDADTPWGNRVVDIIG